MRAKIYTTPLREWWSNETQDVQGSEIALTVSGTRILNVNGDVFARRRKYLHNIKTKQKVSTQAEFWNSELFWNCLFLALTLVFSIGYTYTTGQLW